MEITPNIRPLVAALAVSLLASGCGDDVGGTTGLDAGSSRSDAGVPGPPMDSDGGHEGARDASTSPGADAGFFADDDGLFASARTDGEPDLAGCLAWPFEEATLDCSLSACAELPSCCVGHGDCCAPAGGESATFASCAGRSIPVDECVGSGRVFGEPSPWVDGDGLLHPGGGMVSDSGYLLDRTYDLSTERIEIAVTFHRATGCGASCLESAGVALTSQTDLGEGDHVAAAAGMLLSGSRGQVGVVVADEIVAWIDMTDDAQQFVMVARPTGELTVRTAGVDPVEARFAPAGVAQVALYGRSRNPDALGTSRGARIASVDVQGALCDVPDAWGARAPLSISHGGSTVDASGAANPSVVIDGPETWVAFDHQGAIRVGRLVDDEVELERELDNPAFFPGGTHDAGGMRDPDLLRHEGGWAIFYTAIAADGRRSIGRARGASLGELVADDRPVALPLPEADGVDQPAALSHDGVTILVVRAWRDGGHRLEVLRDDGAGFTRIGSNLPRLTDDVQNGDLDATEIASPSLTIHHDAWLLHHAARLGTRWSVQVLVSDDLRAFRPLGAVLDGSGARAAFDRLGASHPDAVSDGDLVSLFYTGHDGITTRLGRVSRMATDEGGRL